MNVSESFFVQDRYNYDVEDKIQAIEYCLENSMSNDSTFHLNFTSTSGKGKIGLPKKYAKKINAYLKEYNWQKKYYGILIVDFADQELAHKIYSINEKVKAFYFALTFFCLNISKLNTAAALAESKAFLKSLPYSTTIFCLEAAVMVELSPLNAPPKHKQKSDSKV